ncbi:acyl-CoA thioesterase [Nesterenkonia ebinurensis]|uniref:acyl-CoA thioesterase n=1 Tax=Nesterenkonia ebinurensis TaxID=2608252 RepID=UPI001CC62135|nr:thioesterase family protein [Nesterenkonia ebinurensis]
MGAVAVPVELRWGDQDAYGHINNVAILRLLEEARARAFWSAPGAQDSGIFPPLEPAQQIWALVADFQLRYRAQLPYQRDPVWVQMSISKVGGASFTIDYALRAAKHDAAPKVTAYSTLVMVDRDTGRPQRLNTEQRERLQDYAPES